MLELTLSPIKTSTVSHHKLEKFAGMTDQGFWYTGEDMVILLGSYQLIHTCCLPWHKDGPFTVFLRTETHKIVFSHTPDHYQGHLHPSFLALPLDCCFLTFASTTQSMPRVCHTINISAAFKVWKRAKYIWEREKGIQGGVVEGMESD